MEAPPGSRLAVVVDAQGNAVERSALLLRERTLLCESLVYALVLKQRLGRADVSALVDVVHGLALRAQGTGHGASNEREGYCIFGLLRCRTFACTTGSQCDSHSAIRISCKETNSNALRTFAVWIAATLMGYRSSGTISPP